MMRKKLAAFGIRPQLFDITESPEKKRAICCLKRAATLMPTASRYRATIRFAQQSLLYASIYSLLGACLVDGWSWLPLVLCINGVVYVFIGRHQKIRLSSRSTLYHQSNIQVELAGQACIYCVHEMIRSLSENK